MDTELAPLHSPRAESSAAAKSKTTNVRNNVAKLELMPATPILPRIAVSPNYVQHLADSDRFAHLELGDSHAVDGDSAADANYSGIRAGRFGSDGIGRTIRRSEARFSDCRGTVRATWSSIEKNYPGSPKWLRDAKFGTWVHFGPQSVGESGDWYARNL
jgi:hypothetical protein